MVKIGINGFGRIGRLLLRIALNECGKNNVGAALPTVSIINDPNLPPDCMGQILKTDTQYGNFGKEVIDMDNCIMVDGQRIEAVHERDITKIPWNKTCPLEYIVDTTGQNITCGSASKHLQENIKGVVVTGCADIPVFCMGVNHTCYKPTMKTISAGTPSLNCLTPLLRVLHENFKVEKAMATSIHPLSNTDQILDDIGGSDRREGRSSMVNLKPMKSAASGRYIARIIPELEGRSESIALKVPVLCVGAVDLTVQLGKEVSYDIVRSKFKEASECYMKGIIKYSTEDLVSSDVIGDPHSSVVDAKAGIGLPKCTLKMFAWYDAEYAFAHRLYDLVKYISSREVCTK